LSKTGLTAQEGTLKVKQRSKRNKKRPRKPFTVTADGQGMTGRAGLALVAQTADRLGLTDALSDAVGDCRSWRDHDPGKVVRDIVLMLADGGDALRHMAVLDQPNLFGPVASASTANRTIVALAENELIVEWLGAARLAAREHAWEIGGAPPVVAAARRGEQPAEPLFIDLDATLISVQCDDRDGQRGAAATYKWGWGMHPLLGYLDRGYGLGESLAGMLRPGNAGSNTAADHIDVFEACLAALPKLPAGVELVVRTDTAGATHDFLDYVRQAGVGFSTGFPITACVRDAIRATPDHAWVPATKQDGEAREGAAVAELTAALDLSEYPQGSRAIARREPLHPGAQLTIEDIDGARFTAFLTDRACVDLAVLDVRHRGHARVEDRIRGAKDTGARNLPCEAFERNAVWLALVMMAQDLLVHTQTLTLGGRLRVAEPKTLRYQILHTPARVTRSGRRLFLRISHDWPWARQLVAAFDRLWALPVPAG
jgi:hypothetical protein